jgi:hypothetical protein
MAMTIPVTSEREIAERILADYREMPGLSLTLQQAARLWQIDVPGCARALDHLAQSGVLRKVGGRYVREREGR